MSTEYKFELVGGPQDGAKVHADSEAKKSIYLGTKWQGDRFAAYGTEPSERFPHHYHFNKDKYWYLGRAE